MLREGLLARGKLGLGGLDGRSLSLSFCTQLSPDPDTGWEESSEPLCWCPVALAPWSVNSSIVIFIGPSRVYSTTFPTV